MRVPLLLLLLLLLDASAGNSTPATPGGHTQPIVSTGSSMVQGNPTTGNTESSPGTSMVPSSPAPGAATTSKLGKSVSVPDSVTPTAAQGTIPTHKPPSTSHSLGTTPGGTPTASLGNRPPAPMTTAQPSKLSTASAASGASTASSIMSSSAVQQKATTPADLGSSAVVAAASSAFPPVSSPSATPRDLRTTVPTSVGTQRSQLTTTGSTSMTSSPKDLGNVSPSMSSTTSPTQGPASSTRPEVTPSGGSEVQTTTTVPPPTTSNSTVKVLGTAAASTSPPGTDRGRPSSTTTEPTSAARSPASTRSPTPALGAQTTSGSPDQQRSDPWFRNEVNCTVQEQNYLPTVHLKEAKTCDEWQRAGANASFYEAFCSTGQRAFNASRESCTVTLISGQSPSQHWAVRVVVHLPLDPEKVLEQMDEKKDKLEELGIFNVTYGGTEREMVINDEFSTPLIITIVTLAGSLLLIAAIYGCCHQRFSQKKDQHIHPDLPGFDDGHVALIFNRLTEELQTMENGYHDNPTLEVMETSSEMQEKKVNLNGELGDSWIVPLDTLMKEDLEEEEDTHL